MLKGPIGELTQFFHSETFVTSMFAKFAQFIDPNLRMLSSLNNHIVQYKTVVELNDYHKEFSGSPRTGPTKRICTVVLGLSENNKVQDSICKFCKPTR